MVSDGGTSNFRNLAFGSPLAGLRFGDFNGDGVTDVFATVPRSDGSGSQWVVSDGGTSNFRNLAFGPALDGLRFGDFNGDGVTDVFAVSCS
ncbi:FG-GAP-like repeat-containing protein [Nostoc sp.]|uniref:FG-GAP-like repeat-containing protein n=1 Tax=Nostoc sp. TaxID=1180 RepID=UPI003FA5E142